MNATDCQQNKTLPLLFESSKNTKVFPEASPEFDFVDFCEQNNVSSDILVSNVIIKNNDHSNEAEDKINDFSVRSEYNLKNQQNLNVDLSEDKQKLVHQVDVIYSSKIPFDANKVNYVYELDSSGNVAKTMVRVEIPHSDEGKLVTFENLHSQLMTADNEGTRRGK